MKTKNKKIIVYSVLTLTFICLCFVALKLNSDFKNNEEYTVISGKFISTLSYHGEIKGMNSTEIKIPDIICDRQLRLWGIKIANLVQEGKYVRKGDFVIQLTQDNIISNMRNKQQDLEKADADLKNAKIDSTVTLSKLREDITNAMLDLEYKKIDLDLSKFESVAEQRKAEMGYTKAEIALKKKQRDHQLERNKLKLNIIRLEEKVDELNSLIEKYQKAMRATTITTPENGIVMFAKKYDGTKFKKDDEVYLWQPLLATLPDMSKVNSETYVKEIDISKIAIGDSVSITIDALTDKIFPGKIIKIANIGESHKDFDMQVFKVIIKLDHSDEGLKPGMTSNNDIVIANCEDKIQVPLNAVFSQNGHKYVYLKNPSGEITKRIVKIDFENEEMAAVESGLNKGDVILLEEPENAEELTTL